MTVTLPPSRKKLLLCVDSNQPNYIPGRHGRHKKPEVPGIPHTMCMLLKFEQTVLPKTWTFNGEKLVFTFLNKGDARMQSYPHCEAAGQSCNTVMHFFRLKKYIDCFEKRVDVCVIHLECLHLHTWKQKTVADEIFLPSKMILQSFFCLPFQTLLSPCTLLAQQWPHLFCLDQRCCSPALLGRSWGRGQESLLQEYRNDRLSQSCGGQIKTEGGKTSAVNRAFTKRPNRSSLRTQPVDI